MERALLGCGRRLRASGRRVRGGSTRRAGPVVDWPWRLLVQATDLAAHAHADLLGFPGGADLALCASTRFVVQVYTPNGGWAHRLQPGGGVLDAAISTITRLRPPPWRGCIARPRAAVTDRIVETVEFLDSELIAAGGQGTRGLPFGAAAATESAHASAGSLAELYASLGDETYLQRVAGPVARAALPRSVRRVA